MKHTMRAWALLLCALLIFGLFGCKGTEAPEETTAGDDGSTAVTTAAENDTTAGNAATDTPGTRPTEPTVTKPTSEVTYTGVRLYQIGSTVWVQAIAEFENTGDETMYVFGATFTLRDDSGAEVAVKNDTTAHPRIVRSGEKSYLYLETPLAGVDVNAQLTLVPGIDAIATEIEKATLTAEDVTLGTNALGDLTVTGVVRNTSSESCSEVYISAVLFDSDDAPIGVISSGYAATLPVGESLTIDSSAFALPDDITPDSVARYEICVCAEVR